MHLDFILSILSDNLYKLFFSLEIYNSSFVGAHYSPMENYCDIYHSFFKPIEALLL